MIEKTENPPRFSIEQINVWLTQLEDPIMKSLGEVS